VNSEGLAQLLRWERVLQMYYVNCKIVKYYIIPIFIIECNIKKPLISERMFIWTYFLVCLKNVALKFSQAF